ncbi:MAG: heme o synthase [Promethearchaeota archaeon]
MLKNLNKYFVLTKPKVVILLVLTGLVSYLIAAKGNITVYNIFSAIYIGYASSGGAMAINMVIDRDIDILMVRTSNRPSIGSEPISPGRIFSFALILIISAIIIALIVFNLLTAILVSWGVLFYIFGYSLYLKRATIINTIVGGLASPVPVFVGYAAALNYIPLETWFLGCLIFLWNPSHTWTLAAIYQEDYERANIPILPTTHGLKRTSQVIFILGLMLIFYSSFLVFFLGNGEIWGFLGLQLSNLIFFIVIYRFVRSPSISTARNCFKFHNLWLAFTFITILIFV